MAAKAQQQALEPDNLAIWNALGKTDPKHTKPFKRAGGFRGTAIKPIWIIRRLTEQFGPCGVGWGMDEPDFQIVSGDNREVMVYCTVAGWYTENGQRATVYGVGGDKIVTHIKANDQYNRPERWENDDEAFKKAFTDAVGNAFKFVGMGADVHMGLFEDSKYLREVEAEFSGPPANDANGHGGNGKDAPFPQGPAKNKTELKAMGREFWREVEGCGDPDELHALLTTHEALTKQIAAALPAWWEGGTKESGEPFDGLSKVILKRQTELSIENPDWRSNPLIGG
jgi:hypothetical protein